MTGNSLSCWLGMLRYPVFSCWFGLVVGTPADDLNSTLDGSLIPHLVPHPGEKGCRAIGTREVTCPRIAMTASSHTLQNESVPRRINILKTLDF